MNQRFLTVEKIQTGISTIRVEIVKGQVMFADIISVQHDNRVTTFLLMSRISYQITTSKGFYQILSISFVKSVIFQLNLFT